MAHRVQLIAFAFLLASLTVAACGLDVVGIDPVGGPPLVDGGPTPLVDGAVLRDAPAVFESGVELPPDASVCSETCPAATLAAPAFVPVLLGETSAACPAGFDPSDVIENPTAQADSCGCGACTATGAACTASTFNTKGADNAQCSPGSGTTLSTGACVNYGGGYFAYDHSSIVFSASASGGTCKADGVLAPNKIDKPTKRLCAKKADTCAGALCETPPALKVCLAAEGKVACPAGAPTQHIVGTDVDAACAACGCTPTANCSGTLTTYSGSDCGGSVTATIATTCTITNGANFNSYKMLPTVTQGCTNVTAAGPATVALKNPRTVCCP